MVKYACINTVTVLSVLTGVITMLSLVHKGINKARKHLKYLKDLHVLDEWFVYHYSTRDGNVEFLKYKWTIKRKRLSFTRMTVEAIPLIEM